MSRNVRIVSLPLVLSVLTLPLHAASPNVVISQVYGGGGNSGATLKNHYVELFNRGTAIVSVAGWTVQYASSAGTTWNSTPLSGSIAFGHYYLVQEAQGLGGTQNLPTPDASGGIALSATTGKIALVSSPAVLTGGCPSGSVVDLVGYGSANCSEGTTAPALTNTTALFRSGGGCLDTGKSLLTGSYNWSANAEENNYENAIFLSDQSVIQGYVLDFERIWAR